MKRLVIVVTFAILLVGLVVLSSGDKDISIAGASVPNAEIVDTGVNSSAGVVITVTMYPVASE